MNDVRDKTFFAHVMSENCVVVSKSAVFTHVRRVFPGPIIYLYVIVIGLLYVMVAASLS